MHGTEELELRVRTESTTGKLQAGNPEVVSRRIGQGLADARLVTIAGTGSGAPETAAQNIAAVIQTALAAQLVTRGGLLEPTGGGSKSNGG